MSTSLSPEMGEMICLPRKLWERVMAAQGTLEGGMIANMNTLLLPREPRLHVRLLGESRTLCGRSWMPGGWQFTSRGSFGQHAPFGLHDDSYGKGCKGCKANPVLRLTLEIEASRVAILRGDK